MRSLTGYLCFLLLSSSALAQENTQTLTLEKALAIALQNNPNLAQIQAGAKALESIPSQLGSLPDPVISFNALNLPVDSFKTTQENMTQLQLGITQQLPFPGKLALKQQSAEHESITANFNVIEMRWWLKQSVKHTWWLIFYLDKALEIIDNNQLLLEQFVKTASTKYEVGEGLQQDVLLAQQELAKLLEDKIKFTGLRKNANIQLNILMATPTQQEITLPDKVSDALPNIASESQLYSTADHYRALLSSKQHSIKAAESRLELAQKGYLPDFTLGAYYGFRDDMSNGQDRDDFLSMKLSMNVPIFANQKQAKAIDQRASELMQKKYALLDEKNTIKGQISQYYNEYQRAKERNILFKSGIIPQARQTVASMLSGYQVNKVDFLNLIRSQISLLNYEMQYWKTLAEANQFLAKLVSSVGSEEIYD